MVENNNIISWSKDYFLHWSDFQADVNLSAYEDSFSKITYHHTWVISSEMVNGDIFFLISEVKLETQFLKHLSWVRLQNASPTLLTHEQGHFDLAEFMKQYFEDQINKKFYGLKYSTRGKNEEQRRQFAREDSCLLIIKELEECFDNLAKERKKYDEETEFGKNISKQNEYDKKFRSLRM